jgi:hypothetical protein
MQFQVFEAAFVAAVLFDFAVSCLLYQVRGDLIVMRFMKVTEFVTAAASYAAMTSYAATASPPITISAAITSTRPQVGHAFTAFFIQVLKRPAFFRYLSFPQEVGRLFITKSLSSLAKVRHASAVVAALEVEYVDFSGTIGSAMVDSVMVNSSMTACKTF